MTAEVVWLIAELTQDTIDGNGEPSGSILAQRPTDGYVSPRCRDQSRAR